MAREFDPNDINTIGPRSPTGGKPASLLSVCENFVHTYFGYGTAFKLADLREALEAKAFYIKVDDEANTLINHRNTYPAFQGLDQNKDDPFFHFVVNTPVHKRRAGKRIPKLIYDVLNIIHHKGGQRNRLCGKFKRHLLQFYHNGDVVLQDSSCGAERQKWLFCMTERPMALTTVPTRQGNAMTNSMGLVNRRLANGDIQLQYEDGEWFYPGDVIQRYHGNEEVEVDLLLELNALKKENEMLKQQVEELLQRQE